MSEINERGVGPPVELAHFPTPGSWSPRGGRPRGDAGLRSAECSSLKEAPGLPGVSGCFWRLWEGGTWRGQTRGKSASETEGQGEVVVLKRWQGSEGTLGPRERKGSPRVTQGLGGRFRRGPRAPDCSLGQLCSDRWGGGLSPRTSGLSARPWPGLAPGSVLCASQNCSALAGGWGEAWSPTGRCRLRPALWGSAGVWIGKDVSCTSRLALTSRACAFTQPSTAPHAPRRKPRLLFLLYKALHPLPRLTSSSTPPASSPSCMHPKLQLHLLGTMLCSRQAFARDIPSAWDTLP